MTGRLLNLAGFPGRFFISWLRRLQEQLAFAGRLCLTGLGSQARQGGRPLILRRLFLEEVWRLFFTTGGMIVLTGLMSGILWDTIWFGVLDNIGGAETLITLTFSIQLQEVTPILGAAVVTMGHGVPMTVDLSLRKSQGEFTTFSA
ncbi:MAG: hypothetical protein LBK52_07585, partial [Deltaproteobacteria bacterium]|nr:hypothetical protein [Deltaproteobacteria bacterium]